MKPFLLKLAIFGALLALANLPVRILMTHGYYRPYEQILMERYTVPHLGKRVSPEGVHTIVLADSRALPLEGVLDSAGVFNFASGSDSYPDMLRKLRFAVRAVPGLRRVILSADDHALSVYRERVNNADRSITYLEPGEPDPWIANRYQDFKVRYAGRFVPLFNPNAPGIVSAWASRLLRKARIAPPSGPPRKYDWERAAQNRMDEQFPEAAASEALRKSLEAILETARLEGLEVVGVKFPVSASYLRHLGERNLGADSVMRSRGVDVLDYRDRYRNEDSLFGDTDHLNRLGGERLGAVLRREIQRRQAARP